MVSPLLEIILQLQVRQKLFHVSNKVLIAIKHPNQEMNMLLIYAINPIQFAIQLWSKPNSLLSLVELNIFMQNIETKKNGVTIV